jgi:hypothetical protein
MPSRLHLQAPSRCVWQIPGQLGAERSHRWVRRTWLYACLIDRSPSVLAKMCYDKILRDKLLHKGALSMLQGRNLPISERSDRRALSHPPAAQGPRLHASRVAIAREHDALRRARQSRGGPGNPADHRRSRGAPGRRRGRRARRNDGRALLRGRRRRPRRRVRA